MRARFFLLVISAALLQSSPATAATGRIIKVLPHLLDLQGHHALSPSLYDRDAYQARLRQHPDLVSGIRFDVQWKAKGPMSAPLSVIVEMRGVLDFHLKRIAALQKQVDVLLEKNRVSPLD